MFDLETNLFRPLSIDEPLVDGTKRGGESGTQTEERELQNYAQNESFPSLFPSPTFLLLFFFLFFLFILILFVLFFVFVVPKVPVFCLEGGEIAPLYSFSLPIRYDLLTLFLLLLFVPLILVPFGSSGSLFQFPLSSLSVLL